MSDFLIPWTSALQASLSFTVSWSLLKLMSIESVMPSKHFILCHLLFIPPSIFPSIGVFSSESALHIRWPRCVCITESFCCTEVMKQNTVNQCSIKTNKQSWCPAHTQERDPRTNTNLQPLQKPWSLQVFSFASPWLFSFLTYQFSSQCLKRGNTEGGSSRKHPSSFSEFNAN